ncbi:MAG TPA: methyltransferase domain-containing protein [Pseudonocardiaceae bacterium]|nr:methyltransferase domain-containing protein [Pseudonocardiaceae bacterium]
MLTCRACPSTEGEIVLDLGAMPAADAFPPLAEPGPDPVFPLRMWQCAHCGLAQLAEDPTSPDEPRGVEPAALVAQARDAVRRVSGLLRPSMTVAEYGSPHGGSWLPMLTDAGLTPVGPGDRADVIVDCFGMMHEADQATAVAERAARLTEGGVLLLQYHSLATIVANGQWNALRHGHFAYYAADALRTMFARVGLVPRAAWEFDLYGGTVLLAFGAGDDCGFTEVVGPVGNLQKQVDENCAALREWLVRMTREGRRVVGYGAASRAVALLCRAGVDVDLLSAVADASPAKWGRRMPGTRIPVIAAEELKADPPDALLLFVPDLLTEVRAALPELAGTSWFVAEPAPQQVG